MTSQVTIFGNLPKVRRGPCLGVTDVGVLQIALDNQNSDSFGLNPFLTFFMSYNSPARPSTNPWTVFLLLLNSGREGSFNLVFSSCPLLPPACLRGRLFISLPLSKGSSTCKFQQKGGTLKFLRLFTQFSKTLYNGNKNVTLSHTSNYPRYKMYFTEESTLLTVLFNTYQVKFIIHIVSAWC